MLNKNQRNYFRLIDQVVEYSGYQKPEVHQMLKEHVLLKNFSTDTTKFLSDEVWASYIDACRIYIFEHLDIYV